MLMICRRYFVVSTPHYCGAVSLQKLITCVTITSAFDGLTQRVSPSYIEDRQKRPLDCQDTLNCVEVSTRG